MPFDALVMRAVTHEWEPQLVGGTLLAVRQDGPRVYLSCAGRGGERFHILVVLTPPFRRIQRERTVPKSARPAIWADRLLGSTIAACEQVPWERVWRWHLETADEVGRTAARMLIIELAGHLTNVLWCQADGRVGDAYRRVPPGRPGRIIFPGAPYEPPPAVADPCREQSAAALPPLARRAVSRGLLQLADICAAYQQGNLAPYQGPGADGQPDLWTFPLDDRWHRVADWSQAWATLGQSREQQQALEDRRRTVLAHLDRQLAQVHRQLAATEPDQLPDPERLRRLGDALLTWGPAWSSQASGGQILDPATGEPLAAEWLADEPDWRSAAQRAYQAYKKAKATVEARQHMRPHWVKLAQRLEAQRAAAQLADTPAALAALDAPPPAAAVAEDSAEPYRRFVGRRGTPIWVGRSDSENQALTFQVARPDDLWFHVKQYPGSHVLLRCGRERPDPGEILDAAALAAFYSRAGRGSSIPVDYTARKFVKKRPHGQPGQVLYSRERTVYVTPDPDTLTRLGARAERLADRAPGGS
jgi:predicted ribosome quality control (RQC) complex YloA/Tae2 family protein